MRRIGVASHGASGCGGASAVVVELPGKGKVIGRAVGCGKHNNAVSIVGSRLVIGYWGNGIVDVTCMVQYQYMCFNIHTKVNVGGGYNSIRNEKCKNERWKVSSRNYRWLRR